MYEFHVNVGQDGSNKQKLYVIQSSRNIDDKTLAIAGAILDGVFNWDDDGNMTVGELKSLALMWAMSTRAREKFVKKLEKYCEKN